MWPLALYLPFRQGTSNQSLASTSGPRCGYLKRNIEGPSDDPTDDENEQEQEQPTQSPTAAVPEESAPGESQSNGAAERAIQSIEDQLRTMKHALETRLGAKIPCSHPIMRWMLEHAATLLTNYHVSGDDQLTGYHRLHGHACNHRIPEFGETVMWFVPRRCRQKLDPRWRYGAFVGRSWNSDQNFVALPDGSVVRARAMVRLVHSKRWQLPRLECIKTTPDMNTTATTDPIESTEQPQREPLS